MLSTTNEKYKGGYIPQFFLADGFDFQIHGEQYAI